MLKGLVLLPALLLTTPTAWAASATRRASFERSAARCALGVTAPGDVLIRLEPAANPARGRALGEAPVKPGTIGADGRTAAGRYAARLLGLGGGGVQSLASPSESNVTIHALFEHVIEGLAVSLSPQKLDEVLDDDDASVLDVEANCIVRLPRWERSSKASGRGGSNKTLDGRGGAAPGGPVGAASVQDNPPWGLE